MRDWKSIDSAPKDGTLIELHHEKCDGYDTQGAFIEGNWRVRSFFIDGRTMSMYTVPTHWRALS